MIATNKRGDAKNAEMNEPPKTVFDIEAIELKKGVAAVPSPIGWERVRVRATFNLQLLTFNQMDPATGLSFSFTPGFNPVLRPSRKIINRFNGFLPPFSFPSVFIRVHPWLKKN